MPSNQYVFRYDGRAGTNRGEDCQDPDVVTDDLAVEHFLNRYSSSSTIRNYEKELFRLRWWAQEALDKPFSSLTASDMQKYDRFLYNIPAEWCGHSSSCNRGDPGWRPFVKQLSPSSQTVTMLILKNIIKYFVDMRYLKANIMFWFRRKIKVDQTMVERTEGKRFHDNEWQYLIKFLDDKQSLNGERARFIISCMYYLSLRIGDVASGKMGSFNFTNNRWYFSGIGKGEKPFRLDVPPALLEDLKRYRRLYGMTELPAVGEQTPLVIRYRTSTTKTIGVRRLSQIIRNFILDAADGIEDDEARKRMLSVTSHWFRRTSLNHQDEDGLDTPNLLHNSRHSSERTLSANYRSGEPERRFKHAQTRDWHRIEKDSLGDLGDALWDEEVKNEKDAL